jgi:hypothetical protein
MPFNSSARRGMRWHLTDERRVQCAFDDVASITHQSLNIGPDYDERVLPSIGNEVLKVGGAG